MFEGHLAFVSAAYGFAALVFAAIIFWIVSDRAKQKKALLNLEATNSNHNRQDHGQ